MTSKICIFLRIFTFFNSENISGLHLSFRTQSTLGKGRNVQNGFLTNNTSVVSVGPWLRVADAFSFHCSSSRARTTLARSFPAFLKVLLCTGLCVFPPWLPGLWPCHTAIWLFVCTPVSFEGPYAVQWPLVPELIRIRPFQPFTSVPAICYDLAVSCGAEPKKTTMNTLLLCTLKYLGQSVCACNLLWNA